MGLFYRACSICGRGILGNPQEQFCTTCTDIDTRLERDLAQIGALFYDNDDTPSGGEGSNSRR